MRLVMLLAAFVLAFVSYGRKDVTGMAAAAVLGLIAFLRAGELMEGVTSPPWRETLTSIWSLILRDPSRSLGLAALAVSIAGAILALRMPVSWLPVALWGSGILLLVGAAFRHDTLSDAISLPQVLGRALSRRAIQLEVLAVISLSLVGLALRAWDTEHFPAFMHGDEAESAWRGLRVLIGPEPLPPFVTSQDWYGLPTLFHYIEAASMAAFGATTGGVRMSSAVFGAMAVPMIYVIARLSWGRIAGFASMLLITFSHSQINYSRMGGGYIHPSTMMVLMMLLIVIAARGKRRMLVFVGMGLIIGLAQYMYASARLLPVVGGLLLLILLATRKIAFKHLLVVGIAGFVATSPLVLWYLQNPQNFGGRVDDVFILNASALRHTLGPNYSMPGDLGKLIGLQIERVGGYLLNKGDAGGKYTINFPAFDTATIGALWLGVVLAFSRLKRFGEQAVLTWLVAGFTTGGLMTIDAPTGNRLMAAVPSIFLLGGLAVQRVADGLGGIAAVVSPGAKRLAMGFSAAVIVLLNAAVAIPFNLKTAFVDAPLVSEPMQPILTARELAPLDGREWRAYVMGLPFMYADYAPIKFVAYKIKAQNLERAADLPPANDGRKTIVVALPNNFPEYDKVKTRYPGGEERETYDQRGRLVFKVYRFQ